MAVTFPIVKRAQREILVVAIIFSILAIVAVCLRLLAHRLAKRKWTPSDYFIIVACIFAVGLQSINVVSVVLAGAGFDHVASITAIYGQGPITKLHQLIIPSRILWILSLSCTRVSILLLYLYIFPVTWVTRVVWSTITFIAAWTVVTIMAEFLLCQPFAFSWDPTIPGGSCGSLFTFMIVTGAINMATDVVVLVIPMPLLYPPHLENIKKIALVIVFGWGIITCIISVLRVFVISTIDFDDLNYTISCLENVSGLEPCLAIILASIPLMRPLLGGSACTQKGSGQRLASKHPSWVPDFARDGILRTLQASKSSLCLRPTGPKYWVGVSVQDSRSRQSEELIEYENTEIAQRFYGNRNTSGKQGRVAVRTPRYFRGWSRAWGAT